MTLYRFELLLDGAPSPRTLRVERHPSETATRLCLRVLAWCLFAEHEPGFSRGVCAGDEPPHATPPDAHGRRALRVELGLPSPDALERALRGAERVALVTDRSLAVLRERYARSSARGVEAVALEGAAVEALAGTLGRRARWDVQRAAERVVVAADDRTHAVPARRLTLGELTREL